ncbi:DUF1810 domain-containing protein [Phenylobacterium sp.]|uniref:DUF1810 domain-containing protein n=1 Tax=Phenylobacterium sp. TaxID=1871053 RepID=UPI002F3EA5B4
MSNPYDLDRFVEAQDQRAGVTTLYEQALDELRAGRKQSHWMWFVFPQLAGLGSSLMAQKYAIRSREEADAYLTHPLLGSRLLTCVALVQAVGGRSAHEIFGSPDDMKFRSCLTLFAHAAKDGAVFQSALGKYFGGAFDPESMRILGV